MNIIPVSSSINPATELNQNIVESSAKCLIYLPNGIVYYIQSNELQEKTVRPVANSHSQKDQQLVFKINYRLMQVTTVLQNPGADCPKGSILQYFRHPLSYCLSLTSLFCLVLSGRLRQVLLY